MDVRGSNNRENRRALKTRFARLMRARLVVPMLRGRHPPGYTARAVGIGLAVALTPTSGIQMPTIFIIWLALRRFKPALNFNLLVALAWTWITNPLTVPPLYYLYIVTGRLVLGRWGELRGYEVFERRLTNTLGDDASWLESFWVFAVNLFEKFGIPMFVGSVPWTVLGAWLGYRWSLTVMQRIHEARERRRAAAGLPQAPADEITSTKEQRTGPNS